MFIQSLAFGYSNREWSRTPCFSSWLEYHHHVWNMSNTLWKLISADGVHVCILLFLTIPLHLSFFSLAHATAAVNSFTINAQRGSYAGRASWSHDPTSCKLMWHSMVSQGRWLSNVKWALQRTSTRNSTDWVSLLGTLEFPLLVRGCIGLG